MSLDDAVRDRLAQVDDIQAEIERLGPWFHNLHLPGGVETIPEHFLGGDFPRFKWLEIAPHIPQDLSGWRVLDVGCNAGFYSFELARRGADVVAMDHDPHYLAQARWACRQFGLENRIEFRQLPVYAVAQWQEQFDLVWFMGVFYHLRYPLLGLDLAAARTRGTMVFQTLTTSDSEVRPVPDDLPIDERDRLSQSGWPRMSFIEHSFASDQTNWWVPNAACCEALLRSAGLRITSRPGHEIYVCQKDASAPAHAASIFSPAA